MHGFEAGIMLQLHAEPIEALEGADRRGAHGDDLPYAFVAGDAAQVVGGDAHRLHMHLVLADGVGTHRLEGAGAHMEGDILGAYAAAFQLFEHLGREVEPRRGGRHRAVVVGVDSLVAPRVVGLGLTA